MKIKDIYLNCDNVAPDGEILVYTQTTPYCKDLDAGIRGHITDLPNSVLNANVCWFKVFPNGDVKFLIFGGVE